jgi:sugar phosphate isomerase/epimerase
MRLGIDTYSIRSQGWDAFQTLDYAAKLGLDVVQFSTRENLASHDAGYLKEVREHAAQLGLQLEMGMLSIDRFAASFRPELGSAEEQLTDMCQAAAVLGSPIVRCVLGQQGDRLGSVPFAEHVAECVRVLRAVAPLARDLKLKIGVENHGFGDLLADEMKALVEAAGPDYAGVTLDTGNPMFAAEDPVYSAQVLAPYIVTTHFRDTAVWEHPRGAEGQWTILGCGVVDLKGVVAILEERCPQVAVDLETITGGAPRVVPFLDLESDFWKMYPEMPARSLARFVGLARKGTQEGMQPLDQLTGVPNAEMPPDRAAQMRAQQLAHFEQSVEYAKGELGLGERSRA